MVMPYYLSEKIPEWNTSCSNKKKCHVQHRLRGRTQMVQSVVIAVVDRNAIIFAYNLKLCFSLV